MKLIKLLFKHTFGMLLALWVLAEDAFWGVFERFTAWMSRWKWLKTLEHHLAACPPYVALSLFILPGVVLLPFKLLGLWLMGNQQHMLGVMTFVLAKVVGTALGARLFVVLKPTLMSMPWFSRFWTGFVAWKTKVVAFAKTSYTYRFLVVLKKRLSRFKQRWVCRWKKAFAN